MEYNFSTLEPKWRQYWEEQQLYKVTNDGTRPKCYVLDMFPYPSGAGLHVGHPLGYIASDIYARYKRMRGFNVLHPMGFDAFGLPAEQYAIETGQHPAVTTEQNIRRYREQLDNIGFSYDWDRSVRTSDEKYYKWTQWIFTQLFHSWYDRKAGKARPIKELIAIFEKEGNDRYRAPQDETFCFSKDQWRVFSLKQQREALMYYRIAYLGNAEVWWCEALGTVLANDEVVNGVSERGGFPVVKKQMRQWFLRITEYAERLLEGLKNLDWTDAMKDMQRNWIGRSSGAEITFYLKDSTDKIKVFTTRPDTIFGVDFMVLAPEHELVSHITTELYRQQVAEYKLYVQSRSERERMTEVKQITGVFTGAYCVHPFTRKPVPIWISEYVLAGYGTGAIMAVPSGDERDFAFATHFNIPITNVFGTAYTGAEAYTGKTDTIEGSDFLSGMPIAQAGEVAIRAIEDAGIGRPRVNYKLRDAGFSRQRYWGEPFPVVYHNGDPYTIDEEGVSLKDEDRKLPVKLPFAESYKPGPEGQGPLANMTDWAALGADQRETNTMPGYAGSSWYFLRYMDPHNEEEFASRQATDYWQQVDVYVGGTEHAVGHLLYARLWTKVLFDLGHIGFDEPFKKLVNQGMILGQSFMVDGATYVSEDESDAVVYINSWQKERFQPTTRVIDGKTFIRRELWGDMRFRNAHKYFDANGRMSESMLSKFLLEEPQLYKAEKVIVDWTQEEKNEKGESYLAGLLIEKMSKSKYNVVNPDDIVKDYGADTFRMYEMFLGPIEVSKPWDTKGIEGVHRFLKKLWRLYNDESTGWIVNEEDPTDAELRAIHKAIRKIGDDIERFSFNTAVSQFMITVNELTALNCHKRTILEALAVLIAPFAPHLAEELWKRFGHESSVLQAPFPIWEEKYVAENTKVYPVAINGKTRTELEFPLDISQSALEKEVLADKTITKWLEGKTPKKVIYVPGRMINLVV
jgi:leucyl-tRNA synthetase